MMSNNKKILLVDDDKDIALSFDLGLQYNNFFVDVFTNPVEALAKFQTGVYKMALIDIRMPEMDGIELARRATEIDPDLKVMFITGFAAVALNPDSKAPKDAKVLSKPFHLRDLVNEVEKMLQAA